MRSAERSRNGVRKLALVAGAVLAISMSAKAVEPDEVLADPQLEERARGLSAELRCLVCQNQSIDDSHAPLARDLRLLVRERLQAGDSDADVRRFVVARYGEFVLLKPPLSAQTVLLWITPLLILGGVGYLVLSGWRRRAAEGRFGLDGLSPEEEAKLARILAEDNGPSKGGG
jgi:cytochrome c-type biogenesis protein CcmH